MTKSQLKAEFTTFNSKDNWVDGVCNEFTFQAKLYDNPSEFGIDEGRVSKLTIRDNKGNVIVHYDRGWDIEPTVKTAFNIEIYKAVMELLESSPKRFENILY